MAGLSAFTAVAPCKKSNRTRANDKPGVGFGIGCRKTKVLSCLGGVVVAAHDSAIASWGGNRGIALKQFEKIGLKDFMQQRTAYGVVNDCSVKAKLAFKMLRHKIDWCMLACLVQAKKGSFVLGLARVRSSRINFTFLYPTSSSPRHRPC